jgi:hypothetical protein
MGDEVRVQLFMRKNKGGRGGTKRPLIVQK